MAAGTSQQKILADIRACPAFEADTERRFEIVSL
jgi:hypothetical protein